MNFGIFKGTREVQSTLKIECILGFTIFSVSNVLYSIEKTEQFLPSIQIKC